MAQSSPLAAFPIAPRLRGAIVALLPAAAWLSGCAADSDSPLGSGALRGGERGASPGGEQTAAAADALFNPNMSFAKGPSYLSGAGWKNTAILADDFNKDGKNDVAYLSATYFYVAFGNGDGTFQRSSRYSAHTTPTEIASGDFDGNGKRDLAIANFGSGDITIRLGVTGGKFKSSVHYPAGAYPYGLVVADFNGDHRQDLATISAATNAVQILIGNGNGTFQAPVGYPAGSGAQALVARDVNNDGKLDIAVANRGAAMSVSVLLGNGNGTFQSFTSAPVSFQVSTIAAADMNGDGNLDLVATSAERGDVTSVLVGDGAGGFTEVVSSSGAAGYALVLGDYDGDGKVDIAGTGSTQTGVSIFRGNGDGTLASGVLYAPTNLSPNGIGLQGIAQADFDGDHRVDLVATSHSFGVHLFHGNADGTFVPTTNTPAGVGVFDVAAADFNGDGYADVALANEGSQRVSVLLGGAGGALAAPANVITNGVCMKGITAGALNGDAHPDLVVANTCSPNVTVHLGNGDGTFQPHVTYSIVNGLGGQPESVAIGDVNNDGKNDIVVHSSVNRATQVMLGNGDGTFIVLNPPFRTASGAKGLALGDVNGDGKIDVVTANYTANSVGVFVGRGDGTFLAAVNYTIPGLLKPQSVALADVDADGALDIAVAFSGSGRTGVFLNSGTGTFVPGSSYATGSSPRKVVALDLNKDGLVDLAVTSSSSSTVSLLAGHGDGTFATAVDIAVGSGARGMAIGDFDGDLDPDLAVGGYNTNDVTLLLNTSP